MVKSSTELLKEYRAIISEEFPEEYRSHHAAWSEGYRNACADFSLGRQSDYAYNNTGEYSDGYRAGWNNAVRKSNETPARKDQTYYDHDKSDKLPLWHSLVLLKFLYNCYSQYAYRL